MELVLQGIQWENSYLLLKSSKVVTQISTVIEHFNQNKAFKQYGIGHLLLYALENLGKEDNMRILSV